MNCPWHPNKRVVSSCKDCGTGFCIECVRETDQTTLCPDCYRRKLSEIAREFTAPEEEAGGQAQAPVSALPSEKAPQPSRQPQPPRQVAPPPASPFDDAEVPAAAPKKEKKALRKRGRGKREKAPAELPAVPSGDFLSQGPDDDFSQLAAGTTRPGRRQRREKGEAPPVEQAPETPEAPPARDAISPLPVEEAAASATLEETAEAPPTGGKAQPATAAAPSEDRLLQDVMSTLLKPEVAAAPQPAALAAEKETEVPAQPVPAAPAAVRTAPRARAAREERSAARREKRAERALAAREKAPREKGEERWAFLAQPRSTQYTLIATSWWRATLFIALMLLLGAVLWAVPNAYLIPGDKEYGIHAVLVGLILGVAFWWKAGKKHSTKLAVQATLTTFFALFIGEFLHWFLIITRYEAFRTIFFDLVSFKFLWENGADILKYSMEAMFPVAFIWLLLLPSLAAFIVGFGMPPIPEIFFQVWHAFRGQVPEEKEASHGLEG